MARPTILTIEYDAESADAELFRLYWERPPGAALRAGFTHTVAALAGRFNLTPSEIRQRVAAAGRARLMARPCPDCGRGAPLQTRLDYDEALHRKPSPCSACSGLPR